jgi:hypothetical protein
VRRGFPLRRQHLTQRPATRCPPTGLSSNRVLGTISSCFGAQNPLPKRKGHAGKRPLSGLAQQVEFVVTTEPLVLHICRGRWWLRLERDCVAGLAGSPPAPAPSAWVSCAQGRSESMASSVDTATGDEGAAAAAAVDVSGFAILAITGAQSGHHPRVLGWWGVVGRLMI